MHHPFIPSANWYDRTLVVVASCFLFLPVGFYGLWKSTTIGQLGKLVGTAVLLALRLVDCSRPNLDANRGFEAASANRTAQ